MKCRSSNLAVTILLAGTVFAAPVAGLEYRSVDAAAATVLYDAPSAKGKKLFIIYPLTPVEIVVNLGAWAKVRDAEGTLAWIEKKSLGEKRTLVVTVPRADVRQAADANSALVFEADKGVVLELVEAPKDGWAKVRHADGQIGLIRATQVWGL